ncbi:MAG TPA: pyridoxamine 5'-phosphate oxidase family protein [Dehalococcoidia bacterium]|nr:pyridoxamine 5'-phosphate oxidase family protein [Dehalococcoidia bacterium]
MGEMPATVGKLLDAALVCELTVVNARGEPVVHPLIPLWDGERVYMTSSVLFSKKLEHIKRHPKVSLSITDPVACAGQTARCTIQGDARIVEDDPHETWESVMPLWRAKEPAIDSFLGKRFALPLFFERSVIEVTPRRVLWWEDGDPAKAPQEASLQEAAR